jgi:branched-chain amino acid transport system permease protein
MLGAFGAYILLIEAGVPFWGALAVVPAGLFVVGAVLERTLIRRLTPLDPVYNFLLTFGLTLVLQDAVKREYGVQSQPYPMPAELSGSVNLGLFDYPAYQVFVLAASVVLCVAVWVVLNRTRVGMVVRAATERPELTRALGVNVGRWVTPVFGFGIALAGLAGVLAAPMRAVNPLMGADLIIAVFAVVVIGGLGSVFGSVLAGFAIGLLQALGNLYVPALSQTLIFIIMAGVLLWRPAGLFGREEART